MKIVENFAFGSENVCGKWELNNLLSQAYKKHFVLTIYSNLFKPNGICVMVTKTHESNLKDEPPDEIKVLPGSHIYTPPPSTSIY